MVSFRVLFLGGDIVVRVNDVDVKFSREMTLYDFLKRQKFDPSYVACEVNGKLVKREEYKSFLIKDGFKIEVFSFVGGG